MNLASLLFLFFLIILSGLIQVGDSTVLDKIDPRGFIIFKTNSVNQKPCTCPSASSCSCCEVVQISYTNEERKLCFNIIYQKTGLNFDISLDSLIIKSMAVTNFKPFRICSSVPGLFFSTICVHVLELNQLPGSVSICPRMEVTSKKERWQITYVCSSISTEMQGAVPMAMMGMGPGMPVQLMMAGMMSPMMPGALAMMGAMPGSSQMTIQKPVTTATGQTMPGGTATMTFSMTPGGAPAAMGPSAAVATMGQKPAMGASAMPGQQAPTAQGMMTGMKPAMPGTMPVQMPPTAGGMMIQQPAAALSMMMNQTPISSAPMMMGQKPPGGTLPPGPAPMGQMPPNPPMPMPQAQQIVPRPAAGLLYMMRPTYRQSTVNETDSVIDTTGSTEKKRSVNSNQEKSDQLSSGAESSEATLGSFVVSNTEENLTAEQIEQFDNRNSEKLKRRKRSYDVFDIYHQSNRCDRAYRICITRSNQYIVSRLMNFRKNKNKKTDCLYKPARIVYKPEEDLCPTSNPVDLNSSSESILASEENYSLNQNDDTLDAIVIHDDSYEDSASYSQTVNAQPFPITAYSRPNIFPPRTPPLIAQQIRDQMSKNSNGTITLEGTLINFRESDH